MLKELITKQITIGDITFVRALLYGVPAILLFITFYYIYKWSRTYKMVYKTITFFFAVMVLMAVHLNSPLIKRADYISDVLQDVKSDRVAKYYDMRKDGEYLKLVRKGIDVPDLLKAHEEVKILKETSESYQVEYKGNTFEVRK